MLAWLGAHLWTRKQEDAPIKITDRSTAPLLSVLVLDNVIRRDQAALTASLAGRRCQERAVEIEAS